MFPEQDGDGNYTINWNSVATATSYQLQEKIGSGSWVSAYSGAGRSKAYSNKPENTDYYQVRACNGSGCSGWSSAKSVLVAYPQVTGLDLSPSVLIRAGSFTVSWQSINATHCVVRQDRVQMGGNRPTSGSLGLYAMDDTVVQVACINGTKSHALSRTVIVKYGSGGGL